MGPSKEGVSIDLVSIVRTHLNFALQLFLCEQYGPVVLFSLQAGRKVLTHMHSVYGSKSNNVWGEEGDGLSCICVRIFPLLDRKKKHYRDIPTHKKSQHVKFQQILTDFQNQEENSGYALPWWGHSILQLWAFECPNWKRQGCLQVWMIDTSNLAVLWGLAWERLLETTPISRSCVIFQDSLSDLWKHCQDMLRSYQDPT